MTVAGGQLESVESLVKVAAVTGTMTVTRRRRIPAGHGELESKSEFNLKSERRGTLRVKLKCQW